MKSDAAASKVTPWEALGFVWEILVSVAVPATVFALLGRWADNRFGLFPAFTLAGLALALAVTAIVIAVRAQKMAERLKSNNS